MAVAAYYNLHHGASGHGHAVAGSSAGNITAARLSVGYALHAYNDHSLSRFFYVIRAVKLLNGELL